MPFKSLKSRVAQDRDLPARAFDLAWLRRVIDGTLYDDLPHSFHEERNDAGEYIPIRHRRPSVRYALCRLVVEDAISMLFSEGHFPGIAVEEPGTKAALERIMRESQFNLRMIEAATSGSVGSVCLWLRILEGRIFVEALDTEYLTPRWNPARPDELVAVQEKRKVDGRVLAEMGYSIPQDRLAVAHWFMRRWDATYETWYQPWPVMDTEAEPIIDDTATIEHGLGFVPMIWIKNLPGGNAIDGPATFPPEAIDTQIEIDYLLSQGGRGLKYSADPTLLIKEPAQSEGPLVRSASNAIVVSADGDAKLLEINGTASAAIIEYARHLRELAIESAHGNRSNADKISAAQSGRAMELLNQALVWLADRLRITYGIGGLQALLQMIIKASQKMPLAYRDGTRVGALAQEPVTLVWPPWYAPTAGDKAQIAGTLRIHTDAGHMSQETAIKTVAPLYDVADVEEEIARVRAEQEARDAKAQLQVKITE